ncbi:MAG TPA: MoxR family ATPase [Anaerolineales bacterium]|nr:MoxR family ATPase [Anaerolineales bacterium]
MSSEKLRELYLQMRREAEKVIVGLESEFEMLVVALLTGGHVLIEGVPGTAKTLTAKVLAHLTQAKFGRVQFTPDLMPSDILGTSVFDFNSGKFYLKKGPIFTQMFLADEINRAPAKTQSALLEVMEERQVTLEGESYSMQEPFMVLATQNPIEYEGTYPLPEAQLDRFLFKVVFRYPQPQQEFEVLDRFRKGFDPHNLAATGLEPVLPPEGYAWARRVIQEVVVEDGILSYIASLAAASRQSPDLILGASPRAAAYTLLAAKTVAALQGRSYVTPDDVKLVTPAVYRHRLLLKPEAEIEGLDADAVIQRLLGQVEVPR